MALIRGRPIYIFPPPPTLRSLCLFKVFSFELSQEHLPPELKKDLLRIKIFNRNFTVSFNASDGVQHHTTVTIKYDGASWNFQSRCHGYPVDYDLFEAGFGCQEKFHEFSATEAISTNFDFPICEVRSWAEKGPPMDLAVLANVSGQDQTGGTLYFLGCS